MDGCGSNMQTILTILTRGPGLYEFTGQAAQFVRRSGVSEGLATLFVQHTSCSLCVQENEDPDVRRDLDQFLSRLVPPADQPSMHWVSHRDEGPDDMPAHIKAALMAVSLGIPVRGGNLALGQWQGIYLFEHRSQAHERTVVIHLTP
jgi:secondary thiamine-phosphate synthase enzyme